MLTAAMTAFTSSKYVMMIIMVAIIVVMGMFIDSNAIILMMVPVSAFSFDEWVGRTREKLKEYLLEEGWLDEPTGSL